MTESPPRELVKAATARLIGDMASAMSAGLIYVGVVTGLFRAMHGQGAMDAVAVAEASGLQLRYVREWLHGLTANGYLRYDARATTFELPAEYGYLLACDDSDHFAGGMFYMVPPLLRVAPQVATAFAEGGGVSFADYDEEGRAELVAALDQINRGNYLHRLCSYWLPFIPEAVQALQNGGRALDFGCGSGWLCIALARGFGKAILHGLDQDQASITRARDNAVGADKVGAADESIDKDVAAAEDNSSADNSTTTADGNIAARITFVCGDLESLTDATGTVNSANSPDLADSAVGDGNYDLITLFDCLHDLAKPLPVLCALRKLLSPTGTLFVAEPRAADSLTENCHPVAAMFYGFSVFHCMTQSLAAAGPGFGTCMGPAKVKQLLQQAGFKDIRLLEIKSQVNQFYAACG